jgi:hypothetical protein
MDVTGRIASLDWELGELQDLHRELSRQMQREVEEILGGHGRNAMARATRGYPGLARSDHGTMTRRSTATARKRDAGMTRNPLRHQHD